MELIEPTKIKFTSKEILSWNNLGEMIACIATK